MKKLVIAIALVAASTGAFAHGSMRKSFVVRFSKVGFLTLCKRGKGSCGKSKKKVAGVI